jgi:hypothetical protein
MHELRKRMLEKHAPWELNKKEKSNYPPIGQMAQTVTESAINWLGRGAPISSEKLINQRKVICEGCEFWNPQPIKGFGRCKKCGCLTWVKIRMATEKCPIGKW